MITDGEKPFSSVLDKLKRIRERELGKTETNRRTNRTLGLVTSLEKKKRKKNKP